ncbi:MAG: TlyA family RNA methyltransferase [candidate division NC10 bacterium]|nr:TlyA family RNA methyltransferase [candidate division NC10 bacterium]
MTNVNELRAASREPRVRRRGRADLLLVERGLCASRQEASRLILAGRVRTATGRVEKPGALLPAETPLEVVGPSHPFVSRGGVKLRHALDVFGLDPRGRVCLDVGASTGGFTDCLLQAGARQVIAVDVGYGQFALRLRQDSRVHLLERTNIRHLDPARLPVRPDLATVDVSFISLALVLPAVVRLLDPPREIVALVKPQFEVGKGQVGKRGVVRDPAQHRAVLERVAHVAQELSLRVSGMTASPLLGPMGNREFLVYLAGGSVQRDVLALIAAAGEPSTS